MGSALPIQPFSTLAEVFSKLMFLWKALSFTSALKASTAFQFLSCLLLVSLIWQQHRALTLGKGRINKWNQLTVLRSDQNYRAEESLLIGGPSSLTPYVLVTA